MTTQFKVNSVWFINKPFLFSIYSLILQTKHTANVTAYVLYMFAVGKIQQNMLYVLTAFSGEKVEGFVNNSWAISRIIGPLLGLFVLNWMIFFFQTEFRCSNKNMKFTFFSGKKLTIFDPSSAIHIWLI